MGHTSVAFRYRSHAVRRGSALWSAAACRRCLPRRALFADPAKRCGTPDGSALPSRKAVCGNMRPRPMSNERINQNRKSRPPAKLHRATIA